MSEKIRYKFRAECQSDVDVLRSLLPDAEFQISKDDSGFHLPDVEVLLITTRPITDIRDKMALIPDSHVMSETLAFELYYTGNRTYGPPLSPGRRLS